MTQSNPNPRSLIIGSFLGATAFAAGLVLGCQDEPDNPTHCYYALGDQTCAERFGDERPFCVAPEEGCADASAYEGCVAERPRLDCYSPCGDSTLAMQDMSCLGTADETETGDGSEESGGDGDGDDDTEPVCGDGVVDADEQCDDGNQIDDDECSNGCVLAVCGDAIVQWGAGEVCDDGNTASGDNCTSACMLPGAAIWTKSLPVECDSYRIQLAGSGRIYLGCRSNNDDSSTILSFDGDGEQLWEISTIGDPYYTSGQWIAVGPDDVFAVAGRVGTQGQIRYFDGDGNYMWSRNIPIADSRLTAIGFDGPGNVVGVGWAVPLVGFAYRYDPSGEPISAPAFTLNATTFNDVEVSTTGRFWVRASGGGMHEMISISENNQLMWKRQLTGGSKSIAIDGDDNVFAAPQEADTFALTKIGSNGIDGWTVLYDNEGTQAAANGVAALPSGGALVVGMTNGVSTDTGDARDGLLSWYGPDGQNFLGLEIDGNEDVDDDESWDIAVSAEGYAVAVVTRSQELWLIKFVI